MFANPSGQTIRHAVVAQRADWIDAARGLGIVLVVLGHCLRGLVAAGVLADGPVFQIVDRAIYAFHMPLFFLLSGLVFEKAWMQRPFLEFILRWGRRLLWPLVL